MLRACSIFLELTEESDLTSDREGDFPWGVWKPKTEFSPSLGLWIAMVGLGIYICVRVRICSHAKPWFKNIRSFSHCRDSNWYLARSFWQIKFYKPWHTEALTLSCSKPTLIIHIYLYAEIGCLFVSPRKGFLTLHVVEGNARKRNDVGSRISEVGWCEIRSAERRSQNEAGEPEKMGRGQWGKLSMGLRPQICLPGSPPARLGKTTSDRSKPRYPKDWEGQACPDSVVQLASCTQNCSSPRTDYAWNVLNRELPSVSSAQGVLTSGSQNCVHSTVLKSAHIEASIIWFLIAAALSLLFMPLSFILQAPALVGFIYILSELVSYCCLNKLHTHRVLNKTSLFYLCLN